MYLGQHELNAFHKAVPKRANTTVTTTTKSVNPVGE